MPRPYIIIGHGTSGKSTFVREHPNLHIFEPDDARDPVSAIQLAKYRDLILGAKTPAAERALWDAHNLLWHRLLRKAWTKFRGQYSNPIGLFHSRADAVAATGYEPDISVIIPEDELRRRSIERGDPPDRLPILLMNRRDNLKSAEEYSIPMVHSFDEAISRLTKQRPMA